MWYAFEKMPISLVMVVFIRSFVSLRCSVLPLFFLPRIIRNISHHTSASMAQSGIALIMSIVNISFMTLNDDIFPSVSISWTSSSMMRFARHVMKTTKKKNPYAANMPAYIGFMLDVSAISSTVGTKYAETFGNNNTVRTVIIIMGRRSTGFFLQNRRESDRSSKPSPKFLKNSIFPLFFVK